MEFATQTSHENAGGKMHNHVMDVIVILGSVIGIIYFGVSRAIRIARSRGDDN